MKRALMIALALAFAPLASAQLYKHVGKDGKVTYSDQPPANADAKTINVPRGGPATAPAKSYVEQEKDLDKKRKESREKQGKADEKAAQAKQEEERCATLRQAHQMYQEGGRIYKTDEKGERVFMSDAEIEAARAKSRREMDEACKGR